MLNITGTEKKVERILRNLDDTKQVAFEFAKKLTKPTIVAFTGQLGAGKTTFIKYLCQALGFTGIVNSPTFSIMNEYKAKLPIYHYDMYRLHGADALYETGFYDFAENGISLIEWSENVADGLDGDIIRIDMSYCDEGRKIIISENI